MKKKLPSGPRRTHGGYTFLTTGRLPEHRREVERYLTMARQGLVLDLGPDEADLTTAELILVDRVICKLGLLRCVEEHVRETSVLDGHDLAPALRSSYLAYSNSVRLDLQTLGISRKVLEPESVEEIGRKIADEAESRRKSSQVDPGEAILVVPGQDDEGKAGKVQAEGSGPAENVTPGSPQTGDQPAGEGEGRGKDGLDKAD
jgi:hypothetical protein